MKSIRTTKRFEGVIKQCMINYNVTMQDCIKNALKSSKSQSEPIELTKSKPSGKVRNLNGLETTLKSKELQEVVINYCLLELKQTKRRRIAPLKIDEDDYNALFNSCIIHSIDDDTQDDDTDSELNAMLKFKYITGE